MLNAKIKEVRTARKLTQEELADLVGVTKTTISGWETGLYTPSVNTLVVLSRILHTTPNYLLSFETKPELNTEGLDEKQLRQIQGIIDIIRE